MAGAGADSSAVSGGSDVDADVFLLVEDSGDERGDEEIDEQSDAR